MKAYNLDDTIAAVATPVGESGIGIVRISGKDALTVADRVFRGKKKARVSACPSHTLHYGWIVEDPEQAGPRPEQFIDEVILTVMRAPASYTREDSVEINCHGGIVALRNVLELVLKNGCRLAEPGEFTKRAFLNGRIDLTQSEAVLDIIKAKTDSALKSGTRQLGGVLSRQLNSVRQTLVEVLAELEAQIDFPEEELGLFNAAAASSKLQSAHRLIKEIRQGVKLGKILREGVRVVICGKPNVGKSSFLNALLKEERSIVTPIAGTTRDTIEEVLDIRGIPVRIADTAGIIEPRDLVERKAVARARECIEDADIVLLVLDASRALDTRDAALIRRLRHKRMVAVVNKIDLARRLRRDRLKGTFAAIVEVSAKKRINIHAVEDAIAGLVFKGSVPTGESMLSVSLRHSEDLGKAQKFIAEACNSVDNKSSAAEFIAQDIRDAVLCIDEVLGRRFSEDVLERIFREFCIGK